MLRFLIPLVLLAVLAAPGFAQEKPPRRPPGLAPT
jgi:hypothetical protein